VEVATDSAVCGQCHSGEHAPTYNEWLVSSHSIAGIDCADCHTAHDNGLILEDVNATCSSCHEEAMSDEIHMAEDMTCVDCHMAQRVTEDGIHVIQTGHAMTIDPGVCADCHGNVHLLSFGETRLSEQEQSELAALREEVTQLETTAEDNLNTGIVGGAIGALILAVVVFLAIRLGRMR
jgi:predicted CXXCH cytochrome family protein